MNLKHTLSVVLYTLAASLPLTPAIAQVQTYNAEARTGAAPRIEAFGVGQLNSVRPGAELEFNLSGTRGAQVTLQIAGAKKAVTMDETRPGHYEGTYTVSSRDRITAASLVTARMLKDGQSTTASLDQSVVTGSRSPAAGLASIAAFTVTAPDRVRPGDEVTFSMTGTPGAKTGVALNGVPSRIALAETSPGVYQGSYTVRRQDRLDNSLAATGFLAVNKQESTQRFSRENVASGDAGRDNRNDNRSDNRGDNWRDNRDNRGNGPRAQPVCANCGVVEAVNVVEPKGGGSNNVIGTIAGGLLGGVLGNQVGGGTGKDLATIAGAVGGAYAGNRVENNMAGPKQYQVTVRLDNATVQTFTYADDPAVKVGTRVKVENNLLIRL